MNMGCKIKRNKKVKTNSIGIKINKIRKEKKLSMKQLGDRTGTAQSYISDLENGVIKKPSVEKLTKIAAALGVSMNELLYSNILSDGKSERNLMEMTRDELYDSIYALRNEVSALKELNSTLINNMKEIGKIANIKY